MMNAVALQMEDLPHYTYDDYVQWEGRWELIGGIPYAMVPAPLKKHQWLSGEILWQLKEQLKNCPKCDVLLPVDWQITEDTVVQPDILVVCDEDIEGTTLEHTPVIVFEILSPSTRRKDSVLKYQLYEAAGVKYYCMVDPDANSVEIFILKADKYGKVESFDGRTIHFDLGPCRVALDFAALFTQK
jgi:Uma2 family endonuclease